MRLPTARIHRPQLSDAQRADLDAENRGTDAVNLHMRRLELIDIEQRRADPLFDRVRFARLVHSHRAKVVMVDR